MKTICSFALALLGFGVLSSSAADLTVDEATSISSNVTYDNVYVNAKLTVGDTAISTFTLNSGKCVFLPGKDNASGIFYMKWGGIDLSGPSSGFRIGSYPGYGYLNIDNCQKDVKLGRVEVRDGATKNADGYVDIRISNGAESSGHWHRTFVTKILNYRTAAAQGSFRILFNNKGGALAPWASGNDAYFYVANEGTKTILEGEGRDIVFINSPWWGTKPEMELLQSSVDTPSRGILRTQGNCSLVFHNTHQSGEAMAKPSYTFALGQSTNQLEWAHTGPTVISNACILATKADYALPNGPQTGPIVFTGANSVGSPWLDLCGTTQLVNGVESAPVLGNRTYMGVTDIRSVITNSSDRMARIAVRNESAANFCVGYLKDRIVLRKEGEGSLVVSKVRFSRNDIEVMAGEMVISNMFVTATVGNVKVSDATLIVDGCTLDCTSIETSGTGKIVCRNGGQIAGANSSDFVCEPRPGRYDYSINSSTYTAQTGYYEFNGGLTGSGRVSLVKTTDDLVTCSPKNFPVKGVDVRSGTLRVGGELTSDKYWRFTFTKATTTGGTWTLKFYNSATSAYDISHTFKPWFNLGRLHLWGEDAAVRVNHTVSYQGKDLAATALSEGKITDNAFYLNANGLGGGGQLRNPGQLSAKPTDYWAGCGWTNSLPISAENPLVLTFRLQSTMKPASGYGMIQCVNSSGVGRPQRWKVESSANGTNWTLRDSHLDADTEGVGGSSVYGNNTVPYLFMAQSANWEFKPTGAVKVASGATLDLSPIPAANVSIGALEVDFATKGGTIKNAVLAETGSVDIKGATKASIDKLTDLGLTFDDASTGLDNVKDWTVKFDGEADAEYFLRMKDGSLHVAKRRGTIIIFR